MVAVEAGPLFVLEFEEFHNAHRLTGGGHHPEAPLGGDEHHPGGGDTEHLDTPGGEQGQKVNDVEIVDQGVSEFHEGTGE